MSYRRAGDPAGVTVTLDDQPGDGKTGENDDVGSDVERLRGGEGDDRLIGSDGPNSLEASDGNDFLDGRGGDDFLYGYLRSVQDDGRAARAETGSRPSAVRGHGARGGRRGRHDRLRRAGHRVDRGRPDRHGRRAASAGSTSRTTASGSRSSSARSGAYRPGLPGRRGVLLRAGSRCSRPTDVHAVAPGRVLGRARATVDTSRTRTHPAVAPCRPLPAHPPPRAAGHGVAGELTVAARRDPAAQRDRKTGRRRR